MYFRFYRFGYVIFGKTNIWGGRHEYSPNCHDFSGILSQHTENISQGAGFRLSERHQFRVQLV
jgi:hypothetical protein